MSTKKKQSSKRKKAAPTAPPATVLILRTCDKNMQSHDGFQWPDSGPVTAPDWVADSACGRGLHGWLWGSGDWKLMNQDSERWWVVFEAAKDSVIDLGGKVKVPSGNVLFRTKKWHEAMGFISGRLSKEVEIESTATGNYGHAAATGNYGHAAATGDSGHAAATGNYGHAAATGNCGHAAATGEKGWAITGYRGRVKAGENGVITALYNDGTRPRVLTGYVGENGIKADTWYCVVNGAWKEVA